MQKTQNGCLLLEQFALICMNVVDKLQHNFRNSRQNQLWGLVDLYG
jgi:hypothetical protein